MRTLAKKYPDLVYGLAGTAAVVVVVVINHTLGAQYAFPLAVALWICLFIVEKRIRIRTNEIPANNDEEK